MKPKDQLIKIIEEFKVKKGSDEFNNYMTVNEWNSSINQAISTIKSFLKGKIIVNKERAKRWDIIYDWLKENPDYNLVKKKDLLTDKEIMCLAELMCFIKTKKVYPKGTGTKILKKLKALGGKI